MPLRPTAILTVIAMAALLVACQKDAPEPAAQDAAALDKAAPTDASSPKGAAPSSQALLDRVTKTELLSRQLLFGNPDRTQPRLSPDGKHISFLSPVDGVLNVWVAPAGDLAAARAITKDANRGIRKHFWAYDSKTVLYIQDQGGDENWRLYAIDAAGGPARDLTPFSKAQAQLIGMSPRRPTEIVVGINERDPQLHDPWLIDVASGKRTRIMENPGYVGFDVDLDLQIRFGMKMDPTGGWVIDQRSREGSWTLWREIPQEDTLNTAILAIDGRGDRVYMIDSAKRDTAALVEVSLSDGARKVLGANDKADVDAVLMHPTEQRPLAYRTKRLRSESVVVDDSVKADAAFLADKLAGDIEVVSQTLDNAIWLVADVQDRGPVTYYRYQRDGKVLSKLFVSREALVGKPLSAMHPVEITARDGLTLVSYLTLPFGSDTAKTGRPDAPLPMVLWVHGGPWHRDSWGYSARHQWVANRGYAVLSVNFRGSTGFGKAFINAGDKEWAGKMHDDLIDAVKWAIAEGVAQPDKIAIMGGSYGGYATLVGLTFTPELFAAGIDIVGPSNLRTLLETIPPYWAPMVALFKKRVGDHTTDEGKAFLHSRSPISKVDAIKRPLLIGQGANDPRVKQAESDQIVKAMQDKSIPVTYVLYPDEGHGFARPPNRLSFYAVAEAFLARHLGGRAEPIGADFEGATIRVPAGADQIPGLQKALPKGQETAPAK